MTTASGTALRGRVVTEHGELPGGLVVVDADTVVWVGAVADAPPELAAMPDAAPPDSTILPGLIDLHCHGGGGESFPDAPGPEQARTAAREHLAHGTTTLVASLVTAPRERLVEQTALLATLVADGDLAGIHVEGPFLAPARCGAQSAEHMVAGDPALVTALADAADGGLIGVTVAPEVPGVLDGVLAAVVAEGAVPSFGHTDASAPQVARAVEEARRLLAGGPRGRRPVATHVFNGMRPLHHRDPGPIPVLLTAARRGEVVVELIADGVHLTSEVIRMVFDLVGAQGIALVTDAMAGAGMPDGFYLLGPARVQVTDGVSRLVRGGAIAGGTSHLLDVVRTTVAAGVPLAEAVHAASSTPAQVLGRGDVGSLAAGRRADLVVVDEELRPRRVMRAGAWVA
ncbi:amidohydrolase family protein [Actinotalea sp. M2MS4P-6]|uniref:N-acetylglucosamine-6-phosphate deacetylase n=1 Tax=Actinotalea sp. M2MS4P-6 TaxID=2983762 RepID=UPI0021E4BAB6|nr:amidohydrolase family protein [Actinotalea sp. M2MS4P-6]MCV2394074.1 amidohydrolase family protein [Actinotalea sp. M2MS4P-6]